jgi:vacuolar protein sorting-associated protein 1
LNFHLLEPVFCGDLLRVNIFPIKYARQCHSHSPVIEGRQHKLMHGYYCVRLPDDAQRAQRLSRAALQRTAMEYFDTTSPWSEVADRFGIPGFVTEISVLLVSHISVFPFHSRFNQSFRRIPQLKQDVERLLAECLEEIGTLPKPLEADPQSRSS